MKAAGQFDVFFVDSLNLPFFSGFTIYFIALAILTVRAFRFNEKNISKGRMITWFILFLGLSALPFAISAGSDGLKILKFLLVAGVAAVIGYFFRAGGLRILKLCLWCYGFMMLGYFLYFTALIRSNGNPAIDMNNVDNPISLVYYLSREQYGSAPIVYGPHFDAQPDGIDTTFRPVTQENIPIPSPISNYFQGYGIQVMTRVMRIFIFRGSTFSRNPTRNPAKGNTCQPMQIMPNGFLPTK